MSPSYLSYFLTSGICRSFKHVVGDIMDEDAFIFSLIASHGRAGHKVVPCIRQMLMSRNIRRM
jgi:hypothetical protein